MAIEGTGWATSTERGMSSLGPEPLSGDGGVALDIYSKSNIEIHTIISNSSLDKVKDNSSYGLIGPIIYTASSSPFTNVNTRGLGYSASGSALDQNKEPLDGILTAKDADTDEQIGNIGFSGPRYNASIPPTDRVLTGSNIDEGDYNVRLILTPSADGVGLDQTISGFGVTNFSVQFGVAKGTVTDANGDPVSGVSVSGSGASTVSAADGSYSLLAPGGITIDLTSLGGGGTKTVSVESFSTSTIDWQYAGIDVKLNLPTGTPIKNAPAILDKTGEAASTDATGTARITRVPINTDGLTLTVMGEKTLTAASASEGSITKVTDTVGIGFTGNAIERGSTPIKNLDVTAKGSVPYTSYTGEDGEFVVGAVGEGDIELVVAEHDPRYQTVIVKEEDVSDGDVIEHNFQPRRDLAEWRS